MKRPFSGFWAFMASVTVAMWIVIIKLLLKK
jgi:hypothetical protein